MDVEYFDEILCPFTTGTGQKCGRPLQRHQKFCSECGCNVDPSWFVKQSAGLQVDFCTGIDEDGNVCGWQLDCTVKFCSNCGTKNVKQRRMFSPVCAPESLPAAASSIVIAPASLSCENTETSAEELHSVSIKREKFAASNEDEETAHLSGKPEFTEHSVAGSVTESAVMDSMCHLALTSDADSVSPADASVVEADDGKVQQQTVIKSEINTSADEGADTNITSRNASVKDPEVQAAAVQVQLQQQVAVNSQDMEPSDGDSPVQTSRDADDVTSSRASTYQTDVAVYKREARSDDVSDTARCKQEAISDSTSETFTSCAQLSPSGSDSVFCSPKSDISENKNTNNNDRQSIQQVFQHRDTVMTSSETKVEVYSRCDSSIVGERRKTESKCTQSMLTAETETDEDAVEHHDENSKNVESEEPLDGDDQKDSNDSVDDDDDDDDDDADDDGGDGDDSGGKADDIQSQTAADEKMTVAPHESRSEASKTSSKEKRKSRFPWTKSKKKKKEQKKKSKQQSKKSQPATVADSVSEVKSEGDSVESVPIRRSPAAQSEMTNFDRQTEHEATQRDSSAMESVAEENGAGDAVNHQDSQEGSTSDIRNDQKNAGRSASDGDTDNMKVVQDSSTASAAGYRKCDNKPEDYVPSTRQHHLNTKNATSKKTLLCHFHVVIMKSDFNFKAEKEAVNVRFGVSELGDWGCTKHRMTVEKKIDDEMLLMKISIEINKETLLRRVEYKYAVLQSNSKLTWEFVPRKVTSEQHANRILFIPRDQIQQLTEWQQYDGIMMKKPETDILHAFTSRISKWTGRHHDRVMRHTTLAALAMLPNWDELASEQEDRRAERLLEKVDQVCFCVKNCFLNEDVKTDTWAMADMLLEYVNMVMKRLPQEMVREEAEAGLRLASACCVAYILTNYGVRITKDTAATLMKALLLKPDVANQKCADYEQLVNVYLVSEKWRRNIANAVHYLMHEVVSSAYVEPFWLFAAPLYHFLSNTVKPFTKSSEHSSAAHQKPQWWGIADFDKLVDRFKCMQRANMPVQQYVEHLTQLFSVDYLLPRTLLSVMSMEHIDQVYRSMVVPPDACLANAFFFVKMEYWNMDEMKLRQILYALTEVIESYAQSISALGDVAQLKEKQLDYSAQHHIAVDIFHAIRHTGKFNHRAECALAAVYLVTVTISNLQKVEVVMSQTEGINKDEVEQFHKTVKDHFSDFVRQVSLWLPNVLPVLSGFRDATGKELAIYACLLRMVFHDHSATEDWKKEMLEKIRNRLMSVDGRTRVYLFCDTDFSQYPSEMEDCFSAVAFEVLEKAANTRSRDFDFVFDVANNNNTAVRIRTLLSKMFEKAWQAGVGEQTDEKTVLKHIITWPSFHRFLGLFYGKSERASVLTDECQHCIMTGVDVLDNTIKRLLAGHISVAELKLLADGTANFLEVFQAVEKNAQSTVFKVPESGVQGMSKVAVLQKVINWRRTEQCNMESMCRLVSHFVAVCGDIQSDELDAVRHQLHQDWDKLLISSFCQPRLYLREAAMSDMQYNPPITLFKLSASVRNMLVPLHEWKDSAVFQHIWKVELKRVAAAGNKLTLDQIEQSVWQQSNSIWEDFCRGMISGAISFRDIEFRMLKLYGGKLDALKTELLIVCKGDERCVNERLNQIEQYRKLGAYSRGAETMINIQQMFELSGDFTPVETLVDLVEDRSQYLNCITNELIDSGRQLQEITDKKVDCLKAFVNHKNFADWLKKSLRGPKEVKVLVDLAMISATGQGDLEVQKVSCLHAAATGYAPLIYDMKPDMGFREFFPLCQAVWRTLEVDDKLPDKFRDTARQLDWLERVKESHGSVEVNALASAREINDKGIYSVGNLSTSRQSACRKSLDSVIQLKMRIDRGHASAEDGGCSSEQAEKEKWQTLNLQQLNDLQSKLMLVAGKASEGKEQVDQFVEVLDGITRLGSLYVQICNAGCTLFQNWKAVFFCNRERPMLTIVEFGKDGKHKLNGKRCEVEKGVLEHISCLCSFMEDCLKDWRQHIGDQRTKLYYLNHFTTEQLVILQGELSKVGSDQRNGLSRNVYPLLSKVKKNCCLKHLQKAMHLAFTQVTDVEIDDESAMAVAAEADEMDDDGDVDKGQDDELASVQEFIQKMQESQFSRKLALRALQEVGSANKEEGIMWCLEHDNSDVESETDDTEDQPGDENTAQSSVNDVDHSEPDWRQLAAGYGGFQLDTTQELLTSNLFSAVKAEKDLSLLGRLTKLWKAYENEMDTSVADFLSLHHLGSVLHHLAHLDNMKLNRPLPSFLKKGHPNLIVCSQADLLSVVLSVYMHENGANIRLPEADEVLVCNSSTTTEDVELLWRRAEGDARAVQSGKLYMLVNAELLDYDISRRVEESLEKHSHAVPDMQLVVVCCREMEDRCHIINALDRYRVKVPPVDKSDVNYYLKQHFTVANVAGQGTAMRAASSLDPERCCVRVIKSHRAGVGKTLKVKRLAEQLRRTAGKSRHQGPLVISIPLHCRTVDQSEVLRTLLQHTLAPEEYVPRIFHIDIAHEVQEGVDYLLFNLLVLGSITDREGYVWSRSPTDLYVIETMPLMQRDNSRMADKRLQQQQQQQLQCVHHVFHLLPTLTCWSPTDSLDIKAGRTHELRNRYTDAVIQKEYDQLMDMTEFQSTVFQRPFQYLLRFAQRQELRRIQVDVAHGTPEQCITTLLQHCGIENPSWSELKHFVNFLNVQLSACEISVFCSEMLAPDLPGFINFVIQFMIQMSKDFATRSLTISEETPEVAMELLTEDAEDAGNAENLLAHYGLKRTWETSPHPYLFFNDDHTSFTFMGFIINPQTGDILDPCTHAILTPQALPQRLQEALIRNRVNLSENFDQLPRLEKIKKMCNVMGVEIVYDPDPTYELTADNVKKMLAIYMRFRCNIPVIVMGETGCGKTRLIKFMCDLWKPPGAEVTNMILMKVHGGTSAVDIKRKVSEAVMHAEHNGVEFPGMQTVLFFDEANTTEDIGLIKEIMCDHTIRGQPLMETYGLKLIAACNPYRKHSDAMIDRLEHSGLGYHIEAHQTADKLGRIPMRHLVYRVQALPQSMLPLVWDFGQLSTDVEKLYIRQMVLRYVGELAFDDIDDRVEAISSILTASQEFMRRQQDECSFVSLRDVDRTLQVMMWFYDHEELFELMDDKADDEANPDVDEEELAPLQFPDELTRSLVLALGVCYHACLEKRREYREFIAQHFAPPCELSDGAETILQNISWCQDVFLDGVDLGANIARNQALKENVFMMVICIELRIPLFLVGKPGSSKSLAKTIVADAMQGEAARTHIFRLLKSVHMVSYQCSPLSTPDGIVGTFRQCAKLQENQDLNKFVSVVVLDEVGLAEDSPRMPLKTLHPLLEDGCEGDEEPAPYKKVAFIGISNWALDPAKMNRGILVQRGVPDEQELEDSAKGICETGRDVAARIDTLVPSLAKAYLELYKSALSIREFFGLRDFYSLVKMVFGFSSRSSSMPTWRELQHAILRNFGGLDDVKPVEVFAKHLRQIDTDAAALPTDPAYDPASLIRASLSGDNNISNDLDSESRYLLILTQNYAALGILQQELLKIKNAIIIFGSSFPKDQEYTQVCRNINRIKVCMETGQTVILLNLENLYESLYDALNQYYVKFGDQRFVDLGLGTQRVKCRVHLNFRLIVVAEKKVVYEKFPIPLINRLEKHFLAMDTMLIEDQRQLTDDLQHWAEQFRDTGQPQHVHQKGISQPEVGDMFIGYHADTAASIVLQVCQSYDTDDDLPAEQILDAAKRTLLHCATPESIVRLTNSPLPAASCDEIEHIYFKEQCHENIFEFAHHVFVNNKPADSLHLQVTTHSRLLIMSDAVQLAKLVGLKRDSIVLCSLQAFDTEQQFCKMLKEKFEVQPGAARLLILQCDSGDAHSDLIACARYNITNEHNQTTLTDDDRAGVVHVLFIVQLPRIAGGCFVGFQGGWSCHHIDDLHPSEDRLPSLAALREHSVSSLFEAAVNECRNVSHMDESDDVVEVEDAEEPMNADDTEIVVEYSERMDTVEPAADVVSAVTNARRKEAGQALKFGRQVMENCSSPDDLLDVDTIVRNCLHSAMTMIKDKDSCRARKTSRLQLLLSLVPLEYSEQSGDVSLMLVLKRRITQLLRDKEETAMTAAVANSWLSNEAASFQAINRAGTFRRALMQYLESRVTPLLAGILTYIDTNNNLNVLDSAVDSSEHWLRDMWLHMLSDSNVTVLKYRDLQSATQRLELTEFEVKFTSPAVVQPRLPFSWIIKTSVDQMIYYARQQPRDNMESFVDGLLHACAVGTVLQQAITASGTCRHVIDRYVHDYTHMVYTPHSKLLDDELGLVEDDLRFEAQEQMAAEADSDNNLLMLATDALSSIPAVHLTFNLIRCRVHIFSQLVEAWPECVSILRRNRQPMPLDLKLLMLITEELTAQREELDKIHLRKKWCDRVRTMTPVVKQLLDSVSAQKYAGPVNQCRCMWNRIIAVHLFIQHVCPPGIKDHLAVKKLMPLWNALGETADFKTDKTLEKMENFLRLCNKNAIEMFFGKTKCSECAELADGPVKLPCRHVLCLKCIVQLKELELFFCPECQKKFPADLKVEVISEKKKEMQEHHEYKQRCNTFFMDLVSQLCFGDDSTPPQEAVIRRLMGYITCTSKVAEKLQKLKGPAAAGPAVQKTKKMFGDAIDATPVVRSFLLQLLLKSDIEKVRRFMQEFFDKAQLLLVADKADQSHIVELCLLCVHCLEDYYHNISTGHDDTMDQLQFTCTLLRECRHVLLKADDLSIVLLEAVAKARYSLTVCAQWFHQLYVEESVDRELMQCVRRLRDAASYLCGQNEFKWPRIYLMKQIVRQYSMDILKQISDARSVRWLIPIEARENQNEVLPDRFIVCGENYKDLRELLAEVVIGKDVKALTEKVESLHGDGKVHERNMLLSLYREVTANAGHHAREAPPAVLQQLLDFCHNCAVLNNKGFALSLISNTLNGEMLQVTSRQSAADRALAEAVIHFSIVMQALRDYRLLQPLHCLITDAGSMANAFLPTMPQDDVEEVREALLGARHANENPVFYQCPNGHPYIIGNCGRPVAFDTCRQCGQRIGGQAYVLGAGNRELAGGTDNTRRGHIIGAAQVRAPAPERQMTAASTAVVRLLLHMSMYLGATESPQLVAQLINPAVNPNEVRQFLWQHMRCDIDTVHTAVGCSLDDVLVLVHLLLKHALETGGRGDYRGDTTLATKPARQQWENLFVNSYVAPVLNDARNLLQRANNDIVNDERLGNNALMRMLYEVDGDTAVEGRLLDVPSLWRYRARVTLEHVKREIEEERGSKQKDSPYPVLDLFLREERHLRALRLLPSNIRLQRLLLSRLNRSIDHAEATSVKIGTYIEGVDDDHTRQELAALVKDFSTAWDCVRASLDNYAFGGQKLPAEYAQRPVDEDSCLAVLLPSLRDYGLCSIALLYFLHEKQNDFLERYSKLKKQKLEAHGVDIRDAGPAHLIHFHPERDLQPIILANCNYSLEVGKGSRIEYDFRTMEKQVEERFVWGRPRLQLQVDFLSYREDFTNAAVFTELRSRIPQDPLLNQAAVEKQFHQKLLDVNDLLASLDITVGFLVSVGGDPNASLVQFMIETLKMKTHRGLTDAIQSCRLKHVESLWLLLSYMRSRMQANNGQDPFDTVEEKYREQVPDDLIGKVRLGLQHINTDNFLPSLHECILFKMTVKQDTSQEDYVDNAEHPFSYVLDEYLQQRGLAAIPALMDDRFPQEIKVKHCVEVWKIALAHARRLQYRS